MRRRKCLSHADATAGDAAGNELLLQLPSGAAAALSSAGGSGSGNDGASDGGDAAADGAGYGKSLCAGKDIQTAECRGEQCQIGKDGKCVYDKARKGDGDRDREGKTGRQTDRRAVSPVSNKVDS